jgi:Domain of unknown function (DUF222)
MVEADAEIVDRRGWLIAERSRLDAGEATWLDELARFDTSGAWAADGQLSTLSWLMVFCRMSRSTAFEKLRVARQLAYRPQVAAALAEGRISYSAARAITRAEDSSPEVDDALVTVAESATVADVEMIVRAYDAYRDQDRPLEERIQHRRGDPLRSHRRRTRTRRRPTHRARSRRAALGAQPAHQPRGTVRVFS